MRVLNAYAGIGGNRHLWPDDWNVTAIEIDPRVAAEYSRRYPHDTVIVTDAHEYVLNHAHDFDAVWSSPPCPTHSRLAANVAARKGVPLEPDPRLWVEVEHLQRLGGRYIVENVHTYYTPPIAPDVVTSRHYYWTNRAPELLSAAHVVSLSPAAKASDLAESYGLPPLNRGDVPDARRAMRNAVVPAEGLELALAAFAGAPNVEVGR